jgi:hypothetical protein
MDVLWSLLMAGAAVGALVWWWRNRMRATAITVRPVKPDPSASAKPRLDVTVDEVRIDGVAMTVWGRAPTPPAGREVFVVGAWTVEVPAGSRIAEQLTELARHH